MVVFADSCFEFCCDFLLVLRRLLFDLGMLVVGLLIDCGLVIWFWLMVSGFVGWLLLYCLDLLILGLVFDLYKCSLDVCYECYF